MRHYTIRHRIIGGWRLTCFENCEQVRTVSYPPDRWREHDGPSSYEEAYRDGQAWMKETLEEVTRAEHIAWSQKRALAYLDAGDLMNALSSMLSDLEKHQEETDPRRRLVSTVQGAQGINLVVAGDAAGLRRWIEDFR